MQIYKRKYFEHSAKKGIFWTKLIFKTKKQERDFMISFEGMPENFKGIYPSPRCITEAANRICKCGGTNTRMNIFTLLIGSPKILNILKTPYNILYSR